MIDKIDEEILRILAKNGRIKLSDLAKKGEFIYIAMSSTLKKT